MSPRTRIKVAVQRPAARRKISASACSSAIHHLHGAELDGALAGQGALAGPLEGDVEVGSFDHPEAAHLLLALGVGAVGHRHLARSEEHTSELQSLMRISYAVFCLKKKTSITRAL